MNHVLRHLRRAALLSEGEGPSDEQLLEAFQARRDEAAFEALLRRHGPMVFGVCRRVLRNVQDAEDAFQATFLVLARQASSIRSRQVVGSWLYGVAYRTALKARAMNEKRRAKERQANPMASFEATEDGTNEELLARLDYELRRLPEKYRLPVVLCELEGRSRKEVAGLLDMPEGTLSWRLAQARKMLAKRLSRHGLAISGGALAAVMAPSAASASLRAATVKVVLSAGTVPAKVLALTEGVIKAMFLSKLKITVCAAALMVVAGVGATGLTYRATAQQPALASRLQVDELEALRLEIEALRKSLQATRERVRALEGEVSELKGRSGSPPPGRRGMPGAAPGGGGRAPGATRTPPGAGAQPPASDAAKDQPKAPQGQPDIPGRQQGGPPGEFKPSNTRAGMPGSGDMQNMMSRQMQRQQEMMQGMSGSAMMLRGGKQGSNKMPMPGQGMGVGQGMGGRMGPMIPKEASDLVSDAEAAFNKLRASPGDKQATKELERALKRLKEREKPDQPGEQNPRHR